jgi:DNA-binding transcriptional LysR family regulator
MRLDFLGLQAFLAIAERGSFHRAAAHLGISQTALSHRMKKFEEGLGVKLLKRTTRHVSITPAGQALMPEAQHLLTDMHRMFEQLNAQAKVRQERLAIGCLPTLAMHFLPRVLVDFRRLYPAMAVRVFDNSASEIAEHVQKGDAEFGITILSSERWDLEIKPLVKEPYVLLAPAGDELASASFVRWADLEGQPLIRISSQTGNRILIDDALGSARDRMSWVYEVQHVASAVSLVAAGAGLTVVPRVAADLLTSKKEVAAVKLRAPNIVRTLGAVTRNGIPLSGPAEALLGLVDKHLKRSLRV